VKVLILAEYYPRAGDPVRGIWAHRQALAAREAGAEVRVLVLHRPLPPVASLRERDLTAARAELRQARRSELDGIQVEYLRYLSPPRPWSYASWGAWAAPLLARRLRALRLEFPFELIHAHYAVPAGDAAARAAPEVPLVVSVHGHDVFGAGAGGERVRSVLARSQLVLANSAGTAARCLEAGAHETRVVHLGSDLPGRVTDPSSRQPPVLVTVAHLAARKRHADVLGALALIRERHPEVRYRVVGDGPERARLTRRIAELGLERNVDLEGALAPAAALAAGRDASLFVMPSVDEAFGVAYVEAMAGGVPVIACRGEAGPEEIAAAGGGIELVASGDVVALAGAIDRLLGDCPALAVMGREARATVEREFTWSACGAATVAAYRDALAGSDAGAAGSEQYTPRNLLDAVSAQSTLEHHYVRMMDRERQLLAGVLPLSGGRVLSVGCGWNPGRHLFPAPEFHLVGVDADPERAAAVLATGRADEAFAGQAGRLELPDASFDVVLYRLVLHHIVYQGPLAPVFHEAARLLAPGGALVAIEPGLWHPVGLGLALANRTGLATALHGTPDDIPLSPRRLRNEAIAAGLRPELHAVTYSWRRLPPAIQSALAPLDQLGSRAPAAPFGHTLMLIARRDTGKADR
jgi:teichuronic acid biosynthesis glycosyltransferase TuaC